MEELPKPSIVKVLQYYFDVDESDMPSGSMGWRPCHCPIPSHEDTHKSASVNTTLEAFACMGCGYKGDSWAIIQREGGMTFAEAKRIAADLFGVENRSVQRTAKRRQPYKPSWS